MGWANYRLNLAPRRDASNCVGLLFLVFWSALLSVVIPSHIFNTS